MAEYIEREVVDKVIDNARKMYLNDFGAVEVVQQIKSKLCNMPNADVQPINQCKMIPHEPDCRGYTDTFFCTNCQLHIHLGFIGQRYGGNYCIECGAEVEDGELNE